MKYNIYWSNTPGVTKSNTKIADVTSPYVHDGLTNGTPYYYVATAENTSGESVVSNEVTGTPNAVVIEGQIMLARRNQLVCYNEATLELAWSVGIPGTNAIYSMSIDQDLGRAYLVNNEAGAPNVYVVDIALQTIIATIPMPSTPMWLAFCPSLRKAYVTLTGAGGVCMAVIDMDALTLLRTISGDNWPLGVAISGTNGIYASYNESYRFFDCVLDVFTSTIGTGWLSRTDNPHAYGNNSYVRIGGNIKVRSFAGADVDWLALPNGGEGVGDYDYSVSLNKYVSVAWSWSGGFVCSLRTTDGTTHAAEANSGFGTPSTTMDYVWVDQTTNKAYVSCGASQIRIYDVANNLALLGTITTDIQPWQIEVYRGAW